MPTKIPMVFSVKSKNVTNQPINPVPSTPTPVPSTPTPVLTKQKQSALTTQQLNSRFTMHNLHKVAKKGCKSCGG